MAIAKCINTLFKYYQASPLALMREIGIQARLHSLIQEDLHDKTCLMEIRIGKSKSATTVPSRHKAERTQMEVRITNTEWRGSEKSDIVVLRSTAGKKALPITATRYAMGAFDIISKIRIVDTAAVIEVKAACSADFQQRHLFRTDLNKLLNLLDAREDGSHPELHFVLIDKSVAIPCTQTASFGADPLERAMPRHDWHLESDEFLRLQTDSNVKKFWENSPKSLLSDTQPEFGAFVHVWELAHKDGKATGKLLHRYAVPSP